MIMIAGSKQTGGPLVTDDDTVLIPGDISWGMTLTEALPDLQFLDRLPGRKILSRGNHDYWWSSLAKMERFCRENGLRFAGLSAQQQFDRRTGLADMRNAGLDCPG